MNEEYGGSEGLDSERSDAFANFADALNSLENHAQLSGKERSSIESAFTFLELKTRETKGAIDKTTFALGVGLVDALERIGYFGEQGKPFDYDSRLSLALRQGVSNITFDWGASLCVVILTELRARERDKDKQLKLSGLIQQITARDQEKSGSPSRSLTDQVVSNLRARTLALWLLFREPTGMDSKQKKD